jgi:catechol 2,3-dioxygenase-like lactoylglutathione lyase family enzyme
MIQDFITGVQHIGLPTNDMNATSAFYRKLGFETAFETVLKDEDCRVCFFTFGNMVIEAYENRKANGGAGAIDHIAIDTNDIEGAFKAVAEAGLSISEPIQSLPFWSNGVKFFKIQGPNNETIEFCQKL